MIIYVIPKRNNIYNNEINILTPLLQLKVTKYMIVISKNIVIIAKSNNIYNIVTSKNIFITAKETE